MVTNLPAPPVGQLRHVLVFLAALVLSALLTGGARGADDPEDLPSPALGSPTAQRIELRSTGSTGPADDFNATSMGQTRKLKDWFTLDGISKTLQDAFPGLSSNLLGGGVPGIMKDNLGFFIYQTNGRGNIPLRVQRDVDQAFTGDGYNGVSAAVYPTIWGVVGSGQNDKNFAVGVLGELHNRTNVTAGAQNVAINGTVFKELMPGSAPNAYQVGTSWGMNAVCGDKTGTVNPVASCIGIEIDNYAEWNAGTDTGRQRVGAQIAWGPSGTMPPGVPPVHFGYGILMGGAPNSNVIMDRGISLRSDGGGVFGVGIDLVTGIFGGPAIQMAPGHHLAFDANDAGGWGRSLFYQNGIFAYRFGSTSLMQISDGGDAAFSSSVNAPSYRAGAEVGVSCAPGSVNLATLKITNGIVTHC